MALLLTSRNLTGIVSAGLDPVPPGQSSFTSMVGCTKHKLTSAKNGTGGGLVEPAYDAHIQLVLNGWKVMKANNQDVSIVFLAYGETSDLFPLFSC